MKHCREEYDLETDLQCLQHYAQQKKINLGFQVIEHPFLLENMEYYKIRRILNREQQAIVKEIAMKK